MILGIDIGNKGAIALIDGNEIVDIIDMPVSNNSIYHNKGGKPALIVDSVKLSNYLTSIISKVDFAVIEEPITPFNKTPQSIVNVSKNNVGYGMVRACIEINGIEFHNVKPAKWKKALGVSADKQSSIDACHNIFHNSNNFVNKKKHDGRAEACLIGCFGYKIIKVLDKPSLQCYSKVTNNRI